MKNIINILVVTATLFLVGCEKEIVSAPEPQTISVVAPSTTGATFTGNISSKGNGKLSDHGFIYGYTANLDESNSTKISLGEVINIGEFSATIDDLAANRSNNFENMLFARSYVADQRGIVYGAIVNVLLPTPVAGNIMPSQASAGDTIMISGKFYSPNIASTEVVLGLRPAKVLSTSDTLITAVVPSGIRGSHGSSVSVVLNLGGSSTQFYQGLRMMARYTDFTPKSGPIGTSITLIGENTPDYYSSDLFFTVMMGDFAVSANWNNLSRFVVPADVPEKFPVSVSINGRSRNLPGEFTVTAPEIVALRTSSVFAGYGATIVLNAHSSAYSNSNSGLLRPQVKVGNGPYVDATWNNYEVSFTVPSNTVQGEHTVYFKLGTKEIASQSKLKVTGYSVSGFKPMKGSVSTAVEIVGSFIAGQYYTVYFGSVSTSGYASSSTLLTTEVPSGVDVGKLKLSVETASGRLSVPGEMEITGPSISSVSPLSGVPGTQVTIKGEGFTRDSWGNYVSFGGTYVTPQVLDGNTMVVFVPSGIGKGNKSISVIINGQTYSEGSDFNIL